MTETIEIEPQVALIEAHQLIEHYRNRTLVLAQGLAASSRAVAGLEQQIAELRALLPVDDAKED